MIARVTYCIRSKELGRFIGEFLGMGFFESHIGAGECSDKEVPIAFETQKQAEEYLDSWSGGKADCFVEEGVA